jgi:hypothetical protein
MEKPKPEKTYYVIPNHDAGTYEIHFVTISGTSILEQGIAARGIADRQEAQRQALELSMKARGERPIRWG